MGPTVFSAGYSLWYVRMETFHRRGSLSTRSYRINVSGTHKIPDSLPSAYNVYTETSTRRYLGQNMSSLNVVSFCDRPFHALIPIQRFLLEKQVDILCQVFCSVKVVKGSDHYSTILLVLDGKRVGKKYKAKPLS